MHMIGRFLEDFAVGQIFRSGRVRIDKERIRTFGAEFDPQPFHLDETLASDTIFRGLAASGWHTAAMTMRLLVEGELKPAGGIVGTGFDEFRWPRPVRPGDELHIECEILDVRASKSRAGSAVSAKCSQNSAPSRRRTCPMRSRVSANAGPCAGSMRYSIVTMTGPRLSGTGATTTGAGQWPDGP